MLSIGGGINSTTRKMVTELQKCADSLSVGGERNDWAEKNATSTEPDKSCAQNLCHPPIETPVETPIAKNFGWC